MTKSKARSQGHRDGHGFVHARRRRSRHLPAAATRCARCCTRTACKARIVRHDRKGRPEGRVRRDRRAPASTPIIGRLLHESGVWLVAPEDKRYGQDVLIPKSATGTAKAGQVVVVELTEPPSLYSPAGRPRQGSAGRDRRPRHGDRDRGAQVRRAARVLARLHGAGRARCPTRCGRPTSKHRVDLTDVPLVTIDGEDARDFDDAVYCEPAKVGRGKGWRLLVAIADVSHYVKTGSAIDDRRLRARHQRLLPAPRDPDAAGEAVQRPVLAEPRSRPPVHGVRHAGHRQRRDPRLPVLPGGDVQPRALHLHRGGGDPGQHARPRGGAAQGPACRTC